MTKYEPVPLVYNLVEPDGGATDKPPVIILHGLTASKEYWYDIPKTVANATKRKVYVLDSRNHGDSPWSDVFNFDCNVDDLLHFMDTIKTPKAILIGHSMGGITSIKTALRAPERVEKAVIEDMTVSKVNAQIIEMIYNKIGLARKALEVMPTGLDEKSARLFIIDFIIEALPPEAKQYVRFDENGYMIPLKKTEDGRYTFKSNINGLQNAVKNAEQSDETEKGRVFEGPICFIYGKLSPFQVSKDEEVIKKVFPNAELVGVEGATHTVHNDCPAEFKETVLNFLLKE
ncbi:protein ABHD11-like [Argiope bruennichi]|uniref:sn-1-specific diacylglycerol lipase ABHD11 n=1 Tax=Argiope bruennichi TaxID=94029 RepID=A0A8T0E9Q1_ARGBR|nr:protein ABHD11-like [Argiope bruennichi]KAF8768168.1 Protein ABHD11 like protein [Argiope bruennichi]